MREELLKGLSEEQIAKIKDCKDQEEILKIAKEEGVELNDDQLEAVSGGGCGFVQPTNCPGCNSTNFITADISSDGSRVTYLCQNCNRRFVSDSDGPRML